MTPPPSRFHRLHHQWRRGVGALRKLAAGVPLGGERVWPGQPNDLFVAHLSVYRFFGRFVAGKTVLDAGCGTGYGAAHLLAAGARRVVGVDADARAVRYAGRRYRQPQLRFQRADLGAAGGSEGGLAEALGRAGVPGSTIEVVTASNVLEHLAGPGVFFDALTGAGIAPERILVAVPPVTGPDKLADNLANPHHLCNLSVEEWAGAFAGRGFRVELYRHGHPRLEHIDFTSLEPSRLDAEDFVFAPATPEHIHAFASLAAVFVLTPPPGRG